MRKGTVFTVMVVATMFAVVSEVGAQGGRGGGRGGRGGGGAGGFMTALTLANNAQVQAEVGKRSTEVVDTQIADIKKLVEAAPRGGGRRGGADMTDAERQKLAAERLAAEDKALADLKNIFLEPQFKAFVGIYAQVRGAQALRQAVLIEALRLNDDQKGQINKALEESQAAMRGLFSPDADRGAMRGKMEELQKQTQDKVMAVLTEPQKETYTNLKGAPFQLTFGGRRGGRGNQ